jgi:KaiC/GvpD/RAD55 family RecA-like ATPase
MGTTAAEWIDQFKKYDTVVLADLFRAQIEPIGDDRWVEQQDAVDSEERHELRQALVTLRWQIDELPGRKLIRHLRSTINPVGHEIEMVDPNEVIIDTSPAYRTGIESVDEITGGCQGMTVIAGSPKLGKSMVGVSTAVEAARDGWRVVYVNAELTRGSIVQRFKTYMGTSDPEVVRLIQIANVGPGLTMERFVDEVELLVDLEDDRILIVLDSINRIVDLGVTSDGEHAYWGLLREWSNWAMTSRRVSEGRVAWCIVSELSAAGHVKGRSLEYTADLVIRLQDAGVPNTVNVDVPYSRYSASGEAGDHTREFDRGRFVKLGNPFSGPN